MFLDSLKCVDPCWADLLHDVYSSILKKKRKEMVSISILFLSSWFPFVYLNIREFPILYWISLISRIMWIQLESFKHGFQ